jgi:VWFA-related protein
MRITNRIPVMVAVVLLALAAASAGQVTVPDRPSKPLFRGEQGAQRSPEIAFNATTNTVTLKLWVEDINGFFIPNLRRNNFGVFEDGVRQRNVTVEIEHAPITLAVLMEMGGRSQQMNKMLANEAPYVARPVLDGLGRDDKLAVFAYGDRLRTLVDFDAPHDTWDAAFSDIAVPPFSEANFYDAALQVLDRLAAVPGRKALLVISTGIDTFSQATFDDVKKKAESANTPVYVIGLGDLARQSVIDATRGPLARVDWAQCERQLETLARTSGGRAYVRASTVSIPAIYDDIMEHLRVRYVITYVPPAPPISATPRTVQVKLVDPKTDEPLRIADASGRRVTAPVIAQARYTPSSGARVSQ